MADQRKDVKMKDRLKTLKIYGIQIYLLFEKGYMKTMNLSDPPEGKYFLEEQETGIFIEAKEKHWYICSSSEKRIFEASGRSIMQGEIRDGSRYRILMKNGSCFLHGAAIQTEQMIYHNYQFDKGQKLCIGRNSDNYFVCTEEWVSRHHAVLTRSDDGIRIKDLDSSFGTYVNEKRIRECTLNIGDMIFIMGLKIIIGPGFLSINHENMDFQIRDGALRLLNIKVASRVPERMEEDGEENLFSRFPRKKKKFQAEEIKIEAPPFSLSDNQAPMLLSMGSSMVIGGSAALGGNISSVLSMLMFPIMNRMYSDKEKKEYEKLRIDKYTEYLTQKSKEIQQEKLREETILNENYPSLNVVVSYPSDKKKLWNRSYREEDFLKLRIGYGQLPMTAEIRYPEKKFRLTKDQLEEDMYQLAEKKVFLDHVPIMLSLTENFVCGVVGSQKEKEEFLKQLLMQIVFQHSYDEVKIVFLADKEILDNIEIVRYLPHLWNDERTFRFLAADTSSAYLIGEYLNRQIEPELEKPRELEELLKEKPYYIVLAWSKQLLDNMEILKTIMKEEKNHGFSVVTFFEDIPQYVREIIHLYPDRPNEISYLGDSADYGEKFLLDDVYHNLADKMLRKLPGIRLKAIENAYVMPKMITFLEMMGAGKVEHLNPLKRWKESDPVKSLAVPVGVAADGSPFLLDLHEKYQGPHGLIAGMTGSGKSEFIITYILSLAVNFHPDEVAFVLIDYKGGGLAGAFDDAARGIHLPHLVGTITNLDGPAIRRSLMAIESELKRRQRIFNEAKSIADEGTMDIYTYQKLYRAGKVSIPLSHLFIISDEFAELKSQEQEFMDQLISAARIGRSLGVHLILATQKPAGVVDSQISSNAKFRVCLKVQTRADSDEMLRRPEAAELKETGRFYLQVGYNEFFALGQSAWSGAPYSPQDKVEVHRDDTIQFLDDTGQNLIQLRKESPKKKTEVSQLVSIVKYLIQVAKQENILPHRLWTDPLPKEISLKKLLDEAPISEKETITIPAGIIDDPENQTQYLFQVDLTNCRNYLITGSSQTGKTTFLQTLLYGTLYRYSPEEVCFYILDYSGGLLKIFDHVKHCGGAWNEGEEEGTEKFFEMLSDIIKQRKESFQKEDVSSFEAYRQIRKIPLILVVIDNISGLSTWKGGQNIYYELNTLISDGNSVGVRFLVTAASYEDVMYKVRRELGTRFVLDAKNRYEYGDILGVRCRFEPDEVPGRGMLRDGERPLECQIARYTFEGTEQQRIQELKEKISRIDEKYREYEPARRIPEISETETYEGFCRNISLNRIPLGYSMTDIQKISIPLKQLYCMAVYMGNSQDIPVLMKNYLSAAVRESMQLFIVKRKENSIFDKDLLKKWTDEQQESITFFESTAEGAEQLIWKIYELIGERKLVRNEFCEKNNLSAQSSDIMKKCFHYMTERTCPVMTVFESFRDFCTVIAQDAKDVLENIFINGRGYNYYFMCCYYPDDGAALRSDKLHTAFTRDGFTLLYGGQFHRQGLVSLSMEYRNITKTSSRPGSCIMQYHGEVYPLFTPCGTTDKKCEDPDDEEIIS